MQVIDPGHEYLLVSYDGGESVRLVFMKREGEGYPFNVGHHPGTNCQEVIRALIDRVKYLQSQIPCEENEHIINDLRSCLWQFEGRAAKRHGRASVFPWREQYHTVPIEEQPTCAGCGHVGCEAEHVPAASPAAPQEDVPNAEVAYPCVVDEKTLYACLQTAEQVFRKPDEPRRLERFQRTKAKLFAQAKASHTVPVAAPTPSLPAREDDK